jgi:hypothetical protein
MGATLYDLDDLPQIHDIVWCKWPYRQNPGADQSVRPVLVRGRDKRVGLNGTFGLLKVAYGTGSFEKYFPKQYLRIEAPHCYRMGMHKPTLFSLDQRDCRHFLWSSEYFFPQPYADNRQIIAGCLDEDHVPKLNRCLVDGRAEA